MVYAMVADISTPEEMERFHEAASPPRAVSSEDAHAARVAASRGMGAQVEVFAS